MTGYLKKKLKKEKNLKKIFHKLKTKIRFSLFNSILSIIISDY